MKSEKPYFVASEYDKKILRTIPYYKEYHKQITELVQCSEKTGISWLDVGCGTGKMAEMAMDNVDIKRFVFCDMGQDMIALAKQRFGENKKEYRVMTVQELEDIEEFDVITAVQVNHYLQKEERIQALKKYYCALRPGGFFFSFENVAPSSEVGKDLIMKRWGRYQQASGKSEEEVSKHLARYNTGYFPIPIEEHLRIMREAGFAAEVIWYSNMQCGFMGIKE